MSTIKKNSECSVANGEGRYSPFASDHLQTPHGDTPARAASLTSRARPESAEGGRRAGCHPAIGLDPARIKAWLLREVDWPEGVSLQSVALRRLWAGRHSALTMEWALELSRAGRCVTYTLQGGVGSKGRPRRSHRRARLRHGSLSGLSLWSEPLGVWCRTPDRDRKLGALKNLLDDGQLARLLAETAAAPLLGLDSLPHGGGSVALPDGRGSESRARHEMENRPGVTGRIVAYRAGKRCVLRVSVPNATLTERHPAVFLKVFRRPPDDELVNVLRRLDGQLASRSNGRVRSPAIVDHLPTQGLLITTAVPEPNRCISTSPKDLSAAALAAATLHGVDLKAPRVHTAKDEYETLCRWVRALSLSARHDSLRLERLASTLAGRGRRVEDSSASNGSLALIHRDLYAAQMLRHDRALWLVDLDTLCMGHGELDVSTFVAHVMLDKLAAGTPPRDASALAERFVEEYRKHGGRLADSRLEFYLPCALARLGAIHSVRGMPMGIVGRLWEFAERFLDGM